MVYQNYIDTYTHMIILLYYITYVDNLQIKSKNYKLSYAFIVILTY